MIKPRDRSGAGVRKPFNLLLSGQGWRQIAKTGKD